jgi:hypothetical protein
MPIWYFTCGVHESWQNSCFLGLFTERIQCKGFAYGDPKTRLSKKFIGLWFNMEGWQIATLETQDAIITSKCDLQRLVRNIFLLEKRYPCILTFWFCTTFVFILVATKKLSGVCLFICLGFFFHWWNCYRFCKYGSKPYNLKFKLHQVCLFWDFFLKIIVDFTNVDPNPRAWTSSYIRWK